VELSWHQAIIGSLPSLLISFLTAFMPCSHLRDFLLILRVFTSLLFVFSLLLFHMRLFRSAHKRVAEIPLCNHHRLPPYTCPSTTELSFPHFFLELSPSSLFQRDSSVYLSGCLFFFATAGHPPLKIWDEFLPS